MGVGPGYKKRTSTSGSCYDNGYSPPPPPPPAKAAKLPNPDPDNYKVVKAEQVGEFLLLKIHYPDCTNYEGNKILVFKGVTPLDLLNQRSIDPHFFQNKTVKSPVARFVPTDEGWAMARTFAEAMSPPLAPTPTDGVVLPAGHSSNFGPPRGRSVMGRK